MTEVVAEYIKALRAEKDASDDARCAMEVAHFGLTAVVGLDNEENRPIRAIRQHVEARIRLLKAWRALVVESGEEYKVEPTGGES